MSPRCRFGSETQPVWVDTYFMARSRASACVRVGVTNARLGADKRGIAVELAQRLARTSNAPVCLVGADPTDRDVERRTPHLIETAGDYAHSQLTRGPHALDITFEHTGHADDLGQLVTLAWYGIVLWTWVAPVRFQRMLAAELRPVRLTDTY